MTDLTQGALASAPTDQTRLIAVTTAQIGGLTQHACDARELHAFLGVRRDFSHWIKERIDRYEFVEGEDFVKTPCSPNLASRKNQALNLISGANRIDYLLTLDMAKEVSMVENNAQGHQARRYFISCERQAIAAATARTPLVPGCNDAAFTLPPDVAAGIRQIAALRGLSVDEAVNQVIGRQLARLLEAVSTPQALAAPARTPREDLPADPDPQTLLASLLAALVPVDTLAGPARLPVRDLVEIAAARREHGGLTAAEAGAALIRHGLRVTPDGKKGAGHLSVADRHPGLTAIANGAAWAAGTSAWLRQLAGASRARDLYLGGNARLTGTLIPLVRVLAHPAPAAALPAPAPAAVLSPETRAAIDRRAQALALDAFERNRQTLETWVLRQHDASDNAANLRRIANLELDDGQCVVVNVRDLWGLTARIAALEPILAEAKTALQVLERATGRTWWPHGERVAA